MAGLGPATHEFVMVQRHSHGGRAKRGHDTWVKLSAGWYYAASAATEQPSRPNGAPLETMQRARSYSLVNRSDDTIVSAHARMTNNDEHDLTWDTPVRPNQAREIAVPSNECLASLSVHLKSGRNRA